MTQPAESTRREPNRIVVEAADQVHRSSKRLRQVRKNLHEPCTDQLALFDPEKQS
ncbi:hypothetical protein HGA13_12730 [Nocardia speluncae]|uniref:Uncharacterized protein n=1 Tax=Nocardia speluncae TaxID=419477 RepID=A0A846XJE9_9NOCA|nr:hypothetical protein [Nocardia speluncae]NKY33934.1 hypothetical protein [Nocardia speluncae]